MLELTSDGATVRIRLRPTDADLAQWGKTWLIYGEDVCCRECGADQPSQQMKRPFTHLATCSCRLAREQHPWRDLIWILEHMAKPGSNGSPTR